MDASDVLKGLRLLQTVATTLLPPPISEYAAAALAIAIDAVELGTESPLARLEELREILKAGIAADVQAHLDKGAP